MEFFIRLKKIPTKTAQEARYSVKNGKPYKYEDSELKVVRQLYLAKLAIHKPNKKMEGPLRLVVKWCFPANKTHPAGTWKVTRPDTDNMLKMFKDCMTQCGYWKDDAQVCSEITEKFYNDVCGIYVRIDKL